MVWDSNTTLQGQYFCLPSGNSWGVWEFASTFFMWMVMMAAMMLPTILPWLITMLSPEAAPTRSSFPILFFITGYLIIWGGYSAGATLLQWVLFKLQILTPELAIANPKISGSLLLAAGLYQWSSLKEACLSHCESPMLFFMKSWREGKVGALLMGAHHGLYCIGCCWLLMALLFVSGTMSLFWMVILTLYVLLEKYLPANRLLSHFTGTLLMLLGVWSIINSFFS